MRWSSAAFSSAMVFARKPSAISAVYLSKTLGSPNAPASLTSCAAAAGGSFWKSAISACSAFAVEFHRLALRPALGQAGDDGLR